jgi:DNA polymerase-3 subunit delta'
MDHILGQQTALNVIRQALASERVHHAWIFHGPAGVGKFTTALAFARQLLGDDFAGEIENHPDLHVVTKELALFSDDADTRKRKLMTIPLEVLRAELLKPAYLRSQVGGAKVFIVDEAELLDLNGQNTLLKTLEEPPAGTYLILVTSQEDRLLPTIRSRCQRVAFTTLDDGHVAQWLDEHAELDEQRKADVVAFARGSIGRANLAVTYDQDEWLRTVRPMLDKIATGKVEADFGQTLLDLCDGFAERWVAEHKNASKDAANKSAIRALLGLLGEECRRRMTELADRAEPGDPDAAEAMLAPWLRGIDLLNEAEGQLSRNVAPALLLDNLAIQWGFAATAA